MVLKRRWRSGQKLVPLVKITSKYRRIRRGIKKLLRLVLAVILHSRHESQLEMIRQASLFQMIWTTIFHFERNFLMRNLKEYPVTKQEIINLLLMYEAIALQKGGIGDMTPLLLREAAEHVRRSTAQLSDLGTVQDSSKAVG